MRGVVRGVQTSLRQDCERGGQGGSKLPSGKIVRGVVRGGSNFPQVRL